MEAMEIRSEYDVIVVGAGPAGATAATLLAQRGHRVLALERDRFPRFKIGESLMPATFWTLKRLGVLAKLKASAFPRKHSVQFFSGDGRASAPFYFSENDPRESAVTWQVRRAEFDQLMADNAAAHGATVVYGAAVRDFLLDGQSCRGVRVGLDDGVRDVAARVVVDASGQSALLARRLGLKDDDPCLRHAAVFTHFQDAWRDRGRDEGATLIMHTGDARSWFWYIPMPDGRVSVGVVGRRDELLGERGATPAQVFARELARCPALVPKLDGARQVFDFKVMREFSYRSRQLAGDGWVLVGDAFGFLDPIYSSGILLALKSAEYAADAVDSALVAGDVSAERLGAFEQPFVAGMDALKKLVYAFYTPDFSFARFLKRFPQHRKPLVDLLTGDVFGRDLGTLFEDMATMTEAAAAVEPALAVAGPAA